MKSFRFQFIDIDESYTISTTRTAVSGYIGIRAPKGTKEAMLFTQGNEKHIRAMIGIPTAHWPDIAEAIAFNNSYDLYISAPPGSSKEYPSYFGGKYITKDGVQDFWHVTDGDNPNFEIAIPVTNESKFIQNLRNTDFEYDDISITGENVILNLNNIDKKIFERTNAIYLKDEVLDLNDSELFGDGMPYGTGIDKLQRTLNINVGELYDIMGKTFEELQPQNETFKIGTESDADYKLAYNSTSAKVSYTLKGSSEQIFINEGDELPCGFVYFVNKDFSNFEEGNYYIYLNEDNNLYYKGPNTFDGNGTALSSAQITIEFLPNLKKLIWNGNDIEDKAFGGTYLDKFKGIKNLISWVYNIKNDTLLCVAQKSPYETKTKIEVLNVGYDKYLYNAKIPYVTKSWYETPAVNNESTSNKDKLKAAILNGISPYNNAVFVANTRTNGAGEEELMTNGHYIVGLDSTEENIIDVTEDYLTKDVYVYDKVNDDTITDTKAEEVYSDLRETIWYIDAPESSRETGHPKQRTEDGELLLRGNVDFNTVTISCSEEVEPGKITAGGEFTGSLSETGTDVNGANIYWPNVLGDDAVTFIKVIPVNTIDSYDEFVNGFWRGIKIVDEAIDGDVYSSNIVGQRYCSEVNRKNIAEGKLGCAWRNEYAGIINDSLIEAESDIYDDCVVFMEPTGQEQFKSKLVSLRESCHDLSTFISPKIITQAEFDNPNKIVIAGRSYGVAQYIGEFKMYDTYTGKYYYCQPIGDVGRMLARINDLEYGGHVPAGTNINGMGGQLSRAVLEAKWKFKDAQLKILNQKSVNPITYDSKFGLMIRDHLSTADNSNGSDWGWLGHSMSFDLCKREIRDNVMAEQLHKRISGFYMSIRQKQIEAILEKRTTGRDPIWASAYCNISGVNTPKTKAKRQFVIEVGCKVNVFSESILLMYKTLSQDS